MIQILNSYEISLASGTLRTPPGYQHKEGKIGYNGFKQDTFIPGKTIKCEAKPKNVDTSLKSLRKLNGGGNFTDYTFERFVRHLKDQLQRRFKKGKDITGQFLRSANFDYRYFIDCPNLRIEGISVLYC